MIPISATRFSPLKLMNNPEVLPGVLKIYTGFENCFLFRGGTEALFVLFRALRKISGRETVIIPAYTADAVYIAAKQAGCRLKCCDMSLESFNMDLGALKELIDDDTLAVTGVHLFGIPEDMAGIRSLIEGKNIYLIDDFCQALGSGIGVRPAGSFGDASVLSFGKGKNLTAGGGGALFTGSGALSGAAGEIYGSLPTAPVKEELEGLMRIIGLSLFSRPSFYGSVRGLLSSYRQVPVPESVVPGVMPMIQRRLGAGLIGQAEEIFSYRRDRGMLLHNLLSGMEGLILPDISGKDVVWNRFPVLLKDRARRERLRRALLSKGIETNFYYGRPFYFDEFQGGEGVPANAIYFSRHLLTLPSNIFLSEKKIETIISVFKSIL